MTWKVTYHQEVAEDLEALGPYQAGRIMNVIDARLYRGEPDKVGKPLGGDVAGCRRLRVGALRVVYRVESRKREALILAVGPRRQEEVYLKAGKRCTP